MNFVVFNFSFLPLSGPESFCTTRFASALAYAGHNVQVVTMDWPSGVDAEVYDFLVDKRIRITRVPLKKPARAPIWSRIRYLTHEWRAVNISNCIKVLKTVLKNTDSPILISRTHPIASLIVAWHCRRYASKWIAHFSDPIPLYGQGGINLKIKSGLASFWVRRALRDATAISLTCERAKRFYAETYGWLFNDARSIVVPHIGDPSLTQLMLDDNKRQGSATATILHSGLLYPDRGARQIIDAVGKLNKKGIACKFVQVGEIDASIKAAVEGSAFVDVVNNIDPVVSARAQKEADMIFVPDLLTHFPYSPFCASKFAYQVFGDKPIVVFSRSDSLMGECSRKFPEAGLFFADVDKPCSLEAAVETAIGNIGRDFDRTGLRAIFSRKLVSDNFIDAVGRL